MQILPKSSSQNGLSALEYLSAASFGAPMGFGPLSYSASDFAGMLATGAALPVQPAAAAAAPQAALDGQVRQVAERFAGQGSPGGSAGGSGPEAAVGGRVAASQVSSDGQAQASAVHGASAAEAGLARDVRMTQEEFATVKPALEKAGVSREKIEELGKKVRSPEGLTWGQFMHGAREAVAAAFARPVVLSAADKAEVQSFFTGLGFGSKEASQLTDALANGRTAQVWGRVSAQLAGMDKGQTVTVSKEQGAALAKALRLPEGAAARLPAQFAGLENTPLAPQGLRQLLDGVAGEASLQAREAGRAMRELRAAVEPVAAKAVGRAQTLDPAASATQAAQAGQQAARPSHFWADPQDASLFSPRRKGGKGGKADKGQAAQAGPARGGEAAAGARVAGQAVGKDGRGASSGGGQQEPKAGAEKGWEGFARKVSVEGERPGQPLSMDARFGVSQGVAAATGQAQGAPGAQAGLGPRAQAFTDQVESGILRNLGQGMRQLSLEMSPESYGRLNVVLTVRGKDVQAVIRAETPEAEKALSDNLQHIKQALEDKGLTVSRLEVRTGLQQEASLGQQWSGAEKHNQSQERREALERMRTQTLLAGSGEDAGLARLMQSAGHEARISQGGLDVVA